MNSSIEKETEFICIKQNSVMNFLSRFSSKNKKEVFMANNNMYDATYGQTEITISYDPTHEVPNFYVGCGKIQRFIMYKFTANGFNTNTITFAVKEMLSMFGLRDTKRSRAEIRQALKILQDTKVDFSKKCGKKVSYGSFHLISAWHWEAGYITVEIEKAVIDTLSKSGGLLYYLASIFKLDSRNLLFFPINDRIAEVLFIGNGKQVISCKKLYECAVGSGLPSYEYVTKRRKLRKSFTTAIVKPVENALNAGDFYKWAYRKSVKHSTFNDWLDDYIELKCKDIPLSQKEGKKTEEVV